MQTKICSKCKKEKPITEFGHHSQTKSGISSHCLQCKRDASARNRKTPAGIYNSIKGRQTWLHLHHDSRAKPFLITKEEFIDWYVNEPKICAYCYLPEEHLTLLAKKYGSRWKRLTVDCKDNDLGYVDGNLVLACDKCNITKNNMLTYEEMVFVGKNFIKPKWVSLLEK